MRLDELIHDTALTLARGTGAVSVTDVTDDSRMVKPGTLFVARSGTSTDGRQFVSDAVRRGTTAVVIDRLPDHLVPGVVWLLAPHVDQGLAGRLAERFWDHPSQQLSLVGVTGTNGKTTTAFVIRHLLGSAGMRCGLIGTIYIDTGEEQIPALLTTPGAIELSRHLATMVRHGCRAAVAEMSSHGIQQGRCAALHLDVAAFTNLTGDHLDYHEDMEAYASAKARLFEMLPAQGVAVINEDDSHAARIVRDCRARVVRCGSSSHAHYQGSILATEADHTIVRFSGRCGTVEARLPLVGAYNATNALIAIAATDPMVKWSSCAEKLTAALESCPPVPGRLERVMPPEPRTVRPLVFVDYAHTHDALENVLAALRPLVSRSGAIKVVFGCGGDRDRSKRSRMGAVAAALADQVVITSDNPRTEDPRAIIDEILEGIPNNAHDRIEIEPQRDKAIDQAIQCATERDIVLVAGKGHEDYQIVGKTKRPFDDRDHAAASLQRWCCDAGTYHSGHGND